MSTERKITAVKNRITKGAKKAWKDLITRWRTFSPGFRYAIVYFLCVICIASVVWWQYNPGNSLVFDPEANDTNQETGPDDLADLNPDEDPADNEPEGGEWAAFISGTDKLSLPMEGDILTAFKQAFQSHSSMYRGSLDGVHIGGTRGDPVCAAWQGEVARITQPELNDPGAVWIDHGDWETGYINLSDIIVNVGQTVSQGERLGELAAKVDGMYSEDYLEFQVWGSDNLPYDPMLFLGLDR